MSASALAVTASCSALVALPACSRCLSGCNAASHPCSSCSRCAFSLASLARSCCASISRKVLARSFCASPILSEYWRYLSALACRSAFSFSSFSCNGVSWLASLWSYMLGAPRVVKKRLLNACRPSLTADTIFADFSLRSLFLRSSSVSGFTRLAASCKAAIC